MTSFIGADEFVILLDMPMGTMTVQQLELAANAGVKTAWVCVPWASVEPRRGAYEWDVLDYIVARHLTAGLKVLLQCPNEAVTWAPEGWYLRNQNGVLWRANYDGYRDGWPYSELSPWCAEAMAYERDFQRLLVKRYGGGDVALVWGGVHGGEVILPGMEDCWFDTHAVNSFNAFARLTCNGHLDYFNKVNHTAYTNWEAVVPAMLPDREAMDRRPTTVEWLHDTLLPVMVDRQRAYAGSGMSWVCLPQRDTPFAEAVESGPRSCNWLARELHHVLPAQLGTQLQIMLYEVFRPAGTQHILDYVQGLRHVTWVGSQFVAGMLRHTQSAIAEGLRGFLTGPVHPDSGHQVLTPELARVMEWCIREWAAARNPGEEENAV